MAADVVGAVKILVAIEESTEKEHKPFHHTKGSIKLEDSYK